MNQNNGHKKRLLIVDDNLGLRKGLRSLLSINPNIEIVGEAEDGLEAIASVDKLHPDLVLMDLSMPRMDGMTATREIKKKWPETKVLALTVHKSIEYVRATIAAGADGYILKDTSHLELMESIEQVLEGKKIFSSEVRDMVRLADQAAG
jgi:DNA-binding NarL/FixJ family response regulator